MFPRPSLKFAVLAGVAGFVAAFAARRGRGNARSHATLQGLEWFLSAGGASLLVGAIRRTLDGADLEVTERVTSIEQTIVDHVPRF